MTIAVTKLDMDEVLRYMGCPPDQADPATRVLAEECADELLRTIQPRWNCRVLDLVMEPEGVRLDGGLLLPGEDLKRHLDHCDRVVLFCATLGAGVDGLIRRNQSLDMARALALDCCATAAVEEVCDQIERDVQSMFPGRYFPSRYSPGYGDLPLAVQNDLLDLLDAPRRVGLCATASHILTPRKSVTAILGVASDLIENSARSCLGCPGYDGCQYRKSGGHCGIS